MTFASKLTDNQRMEIQREVGTLSEIADKYGVSINTISRVRSQAPMRVSLDERTLPGRGVVDLEAVAAAWEDGQTYTPGDEDDRFKIDRSQIPDGMDYLWIAVSVFGQPNTSRIARFHQKGWRPVPASRHEGVFTPRGFDGPIELDGLMLHERPLLYTIKAREHEQRKARMQMQTKESQLMGGDIPGITLDSKHQSVVRTNQIRSNFERVTVPEE